MSNLDLWESVQTTDPKYTKGFSKGGGFKGTSINPTYNNHKATEMFGLCGTGWGANIIKEDWREGAPLFINGVAVCKEVVHVLQIEFWYIKDDKKGTIPSFGQTTFVGQNKNGIFSDEEAPKKSLTDAITKAMSMLGFGADIFLGLYDDVKYVNDRKEEYAPPKVSSRHYLYEEQKKLLDINKGASKEALLGWWNAAENKQIRAEIKKYSEADYLDLKARLDSALMAFAS